MDYTLCQLNANGVNYPNALTVAPSSRIKVQNLTAMGTCTIYSFVKEGMTRKLENVLHRVDQYMSGTPAIAGANAAVGKVIGSLTSTILNS